eukprot:TRINITY_DN147_c1_g1_i1.p1 TRINITY_DN147_c1_g1~~TRINITY_DN147_c1_g1_i1.p1  ORF type:complete len:245 (-),score=93.81 TRINITY_DN147_c1_g1_i1:471-1127(-)
MPFWSKKKKEKKGKKEEDTPAAAAVEDDTPAPIEEKVAAEPVAPEEIEVALCVVGDDGCGKTTLLSTGGEEQKEEGDGGGDGMFKCYQTSFSMDDANVTLTMTDTESSEKYSRFRALTYKTTDVFLLCFSLTDKGTYISAKNDWAEELETLCGDVPVFLIGTKSDQRDDADDAVSTEEGEQLKSDIGAVEYIECVSTDADSVKSVLTKAVGHILSEEE